MEADDLIHLTTTLTYGTRWMGGCVGPRTGLEVSGKKKMSCPCWESFPISRFFRPSIVTMPTELPQLWSVIKVKPNNTIPYTCNLCKWNLLSSSMRKEIVFQTASMSTTHQILLSPWNIFGLLYQETQINLYHAGFAFVSCVQIRYRVAQCSYWHPVIWKMQFIRENNMHAQITS
jgi:hypothetical protein